MSALGRHESRHCTENHGELDFATSRGMTFVNLVSVFRATLRNSGGDVIIRLVVNPETASHLILHSAGGGHH